MKKEMKAESVPKISVIIPVYNAEKYVGKCLDSVLAQSYKDFEVLCFNDGSSDGSLKVLREYEKKDKRIEVIDQKNIGVAKTRNKAIKMARGEFIAFMDNDDYIDRDYLEKLLPRNGEDAVIGGFKRPDENGKIVTKMQLEDARWNKFMNPTPWAKIYRKDFIVKNKLEFLDNDIGEDVYFNLVAMLATDKIRILNYTGYNWFYNLGSVSSTKHKKYGEVDIFKLLNSCYDELEARKLLDKNYELLEFFFYRFVVWFLLYAAKGATKKEIDKIYDELFGWLEERFPDYRKNKMLKGDLLGEVKSTRLIYQTFMKFHKIGLGKMLVWGYAKI